jgi:hypothetical protein
VSARPVAPPALAVWILSRVARPDDRDALLGDLEETFLTEILPARGARVAWLWYWRQTLLAPLGIRALGRETGATQPSRGDGTMTGTLGDLRFALRILARRPGFAVLAVITLALGIGATTAIFSAVYPILVAPLPYPHAERIAMVWEHEKDGSTSNVGWQTYDDLRAGGGARASTLRRSSSRSRRCCRRKARRRFGARSWPCQL